MFTGTIYDDFSNIEDFATILQRSSNTSSIIHFMGKIYPKSFETLKHLQKEMPGRINIHGIKPYDYAKGSMQKADILINLANNNANQIPSKIFEYIACRKPILNIFRIKNDIGTQYLRLYPLAFNFDLNDIEGQLPLFEEWLKTVFKKTITLEELKSIYKPLLSNTVKNDFYKIASPILNKNMHDESH